MPVPCGRVRVDAPTATLSSAILRAVSGHEATLVAMSTHGRRGLHRLVMGSATEVVVRLSPVPVIVVHPPTVG